MEEARVLACCALSYGHPLVRWLFGGDCLHPGGLALTDRLADALGLGPGHQVLDAGCGLGAAAVHLARRWGCRVVGLTLEAEGPAAARLRALEQGVGHRTAFLRGDLQELPLVPGAFDAVMVECVLSILPRKEEAVTGLASALKPSGRLGMTDVTVSGPLPSDLRGPLAAAACVGGALDLEGYRRLLEGAGLTVERAEALPQVAVGFLERLGARLLMAKAVARLGGLPADGALVEKALEVVDRARALAERGTLGYCLVVARRPGGLSGA